MSDIITGVLALVVGLALCFRGYLAMRILLPIWGALFGFGVGVGIVEAVTGDGVLSTVLSWAAGIGVALLFGMAAYLYYEACVVLTMGAAGFVLGTTVLVALDIEWTWLVTLGGLVVGLVFGFLAVMVDLPMLLLTTLTAVAGASAATAGLMLLTGAVDAADFDEGTVVQSFDTGGIWWFVYVGLAVVGVVLQVRALSSMRRSIRDQWVSGGGRSLFDPARR
ncbi:MAG: DUF4203 domain-containing protein [Actinomycetota bacterium]|nr:DUF4203 domain-containing protein [Actinomycetota bacterium]